MPCEGTAHCNRVQRLFFSFFFVHPSKLTLSHRGPHWQTLFHCSQRNQKLTPGDAGPKTNALRPLLDRNETPLLCWKYWKRYQRQTVRLYPPLWKRLRVSPASATSSPVLYKQLKVCHCSFLLFLNLNVLLYKLQVDPYEVQTLPSNWELNKCLIWGGAAVVSSRGVKLLSTF